MKHGSKAVRVGAPDPELKTSPILDEFDDEDTPLAAEEFDELPVCWFNGVAYESGAIVHSGDGAILHCEKGVWVRQGSLDPDDL